MIGAEGMTVDHKRTDQDEELVWEHVEGSGEGSER